MNPSRVRVAAVSLLALALLSDCGGGNGGSTPAASPASTQVSGASTLAAPPCSTASPAGTTETSTSGSGIQPQVAAIPGGNLVAVWEQDRWSGLGARAALTASSSDGGATWSQARILPFSACAGGSSPGAAFDRASDPWVTFAGSGVVVASAIAFMANAYTVAGFPASGQASAVLVSRSADGGATWSTPAPVFQDLNTGSTKFFNDRDSIAADPSSGNVYLVWDRLTNGVTNGVANSDPAWIAVSSDGGVTWPSSGTGAPHVLYDPGAGNEAFDNQIAVLPNGRLLDIFTLISSAGTFTLQAVTSTDHGATWTTSPVTIATQTSIGTQNPIAGGPAVRDSWVMAQVAVDPASGSVAAVWQQSFNGSFDGIALTVSTDGNGQTWSAPVQINGAPAAAAFSPTVRYLPGGVLAVTYYDLRDYVSGSAVLSTDAWLTESSDGGKTWHEIRLQPPFDLSKAPLTDNNRPFGISPALFLGDNQGLALAGTAALPVYAAAGVASGLGARVYATQAPNPLTSPTAHNY